MSGWWRRMINLAAACVLAGGALTVLPGCREKGPAERAGEAIDEAGEDIGEAAEDVARDID